MKRACPTILELLAFDAVARHQSVTVAAKDLCISVSGVSKQIAGLESYLGRMLFAKKGRGVELTLAGCEYWGRIAPCLRAIEAATLDVRESDAGAGILILACVPTFLSRWLIPRLPDFRRYDPVANFAFRQHVGVSTPFPSEIDAAITHSPVRWPNVVCDYIAGREFVCIRSPDLVLKRASDREVADLLENTLLHLEDAPLTWRDWAVHHGYDETQALFGPHFAQYSAVIQAVLSRLGIGLVPRFLVENQIQEGRIVVISTLIDEAQGHYLCYRSERIERPVFSTFRAWLLEQGGRSA